MILLAAPRIFPGGGAIAVLTQMGSAIVFGLAYNMLLGQSGLLSLGHAIYFGLGAFCTAHAMNAAAHGSLWLPVSMAPLAAGMAALFFGVLFGYVTTRKSGTTFAMITLGIGELAFVSAAMFPDFFGGDTGISTSRVYGKPVSGITFGPALQAYYLVAVWVFIATIAMFALTRTPLGAMANAVRDNPERARFVGYSPQRVRFITLVLSSFFAGLAGGLMVLNFEIVTPEALSVSQSGAVLLFTYIGGTSAFFGPIIGAVVGTLLTVTVSTLTQAWPLYLGVFFILVVKFAPDGIAGLGLSLWHLSKNKQLVPAIPSLAALVGAWLMALGGTILLVEMAYKRTLGTGDAPALTILGYALDAASPANWLMGGVLLAAGTAAMIALRRRESHA